jgi:hypothetical protein
LFVWEGFGAGAAYPKGLIELFVGDLTSQVRFAPLTRVWFFRTKLRVQIKKLGLFLFKQKRSRPRAAAFPK